MYFNSLEYDTLHEKQRFKEVYFNSLTKFIMIE